MKCLTKQLAGLLPVLVLFPLSGCASRSDYTLNPPASTEWVTVAVKFPPETEVVPLDVLYRSETCRREDYDPTTESHVRTIRGFNPVRLPLGSSDSNGVRTVRIALEGGTKCSWTLSGIRLGLQLAKTSALANGKNVTAANYVFDFDNEGYGSAFGEGKPNPVSGDLVFKTEFFPMITINNMFHETYAQLFAGNTKYEKWNRYYRLNGAESIRIEPILYSQKVVKLESPKSRNDNPGMTVLYPDGTTEKISGITPDYAKLLSMK